MEMKEEILKRLDNANQEFDSNLAYGIKLWKSNSFYYMSKYEVIFEFFVDRVVEFYHRLECTPVEEFESKWQIVNEFLALPCPSNALPPRLLPKLRAAFSALGNGTDSRVLVESYLISTFDVKYKNFYKFDYKSYGQSLALAMDYYQKFLKKNFLKSQEEETIQRILDDIRVYVKSAGDDGSWQEAFTFALTNLCNVILVLKAHGLDKQDDLLSLLKEVYFQDGKSSQYNRVMDQSKKHLLMGYFDPKSIPIHVVALLIEGYLKAYREIKLDILLFLKYILLHVFVDPRISILSEAHQVFQLTNYVFHLLKKYFIKIDQKLVQDFDFNGIFTIKLKEFLEKYEDSEEHLRYILTLICTINEYNPLILETSIIDIMLRTMFIKKGPETLEKFQSMLISTIGLFVKLNRSENFREELFMKLGDYLDDYDLGSRLKELRKSSKKRKSMASEEDTLVKRRKLDNGQEEVVLLDCTENDYYIRFLYPSNMDDSIRNVKRLQLQDQWKSIAFAWPDSNGRLNQAMMDYVKGLLTKRSFSYWHKMLDYLDGSLDALSKDQQSEIELFKLEFATCWMCYFFVGNTLIEQTNLFWEKLGKHFLEFDELLMKFGRMLLNETAADSRMFHSFLNLVYFYGNYQLLVHYYRPDSINNSSSDRIHQFLSKDEWSKLEERIPTSVSSLLNRIYLQKIRALRLSGESMDEFEEQSGLIEKILAPDSFDQMRWLLMDRSANYWFIQLLSLEQKVSIIDRLLQNSCFSEIEFAIEQLPDDHDLIAVVILSSYKLIIDKIFMEQKASIARKLTFGEIYEFDEDVVMKRIRKLLEKKAEKKDELVSIGNTDQLKDLLTVLNTIRIDALPDAQKTIIVSVSILLFTDLMNCGNSELINLHCNIVNKQLTFGIVPNLLKFLDIEILIKIFGQSSPVMVTFIRQTATYLTQEAFDYFRSMLENFLNQTDERFELVLTIFLYLQKSNSNRRKLIAAEQLSELLTQYASALETYIGSKSAKKVRKSDSVLFDQLLKACSLIIHYKATNKKELSNELREVFLQLIDQALKSDSLSSSTLLTSALQHKDFLKVDPERIELLVENRWTGFLTQLKTECPNGMFSTVDSNIHATNMKLNNFKVFVAFLTHHQPAQKLKVRFDKLEKEVASERSFRSKQFVLRVYSTLAKNGFAAGVSQEVEKVFVRSFGMVLADEIIPLCVMKKFFDDRSCLEEILSCFAAVVGNQKLTLVPSIMDNMLEFLSSINIKKCAVKDGEEKEFYKLHRLISDVLYLMMIIRPNYVTNRLPQYFYVFNGLIASVICYKENRPQEMPLNSFEILTLSDLLLPLDKIMSHAAKKVAKDLRIMAPYVLAQVIHFIIQSKRPATLHEKISRTVYNICYGLIEIYDKHSSSYLLRTCDEASKNVYTDIVKGFQKYRSFKGKV